jgi:hypothetical protein
MAHPFFSTPNVFYEALTIIGEPRGLPQVSFLPTSLQVKHPTICTSRLLHTTYIHTYVPIYTPIRSSVTACTVWIVVSYANVPFQVFFLVNPCQQLPLCPTVVSNVKNPPKHKFAQCDFTSFSMEVSANSHNFRFRLPALHIQNLSNRCRHKYDSLISRIFWISFLAGFCDFGQLCGALPTPPTFHALVKHLQS